LAASVCQPRAEIEAARFRAWRRVRPVAAKIGTAARPCLPDHFDSLLPPTLTSFLPDLRARCSEFLAESALMDDLE